ncbi:hypothetical protein SPHINGOAX6_30128 [Sphingomonas sp. AX6]|nr:hypothetical protein SPHINGOAX6_30128 [Sphingomonas sp. AX6]
MIDLKHRTMELKTKQLQVVKNMAAVANGNAEPEMALAQ